MINYIKGTITETMPGMVTIENGGIGWGVYVPDGSAAFLPGEGPVTIYTAMLVRDDGVSLYGFTDRESRALFLLLITVSGVGAKAAMSVLSALGLSELKNAIAFEDTKSLMKANGIGKKTAQRIILELKDKVTAVEGAVKEPSAGSLFEGTRDAAAGALMSLGYTKSEALSALSGIKDEALSVEEMIRLALRGRG